MQKPPEILRRQAGKQTRRNQMAISDGHSGIFDFFISYKQKDAKAFAKRLAEVLTTNGVEVWLDQVEMKPGDSILSGIEEGIRSSVDAIVILSENYFSGWSEQERRNLYALMVSRKIRIIPIWYKLDLDNVETLAPMFAGIVSIQVATDNDEEALQVGAEILQKYNPSQRESRLYELFFRAVRKHVADPDIDLFLGVFENDIKLLESALKAGGNPNVTDAALWNRYNKIITEHEDIFPIWRKLFLHLSAAGKIGRQT
jgi:hypothetical protein